MTWKFPGEEVDGWLSENEGEALSRYAAVARVLEIGSYKGKSAICIAQTASHLDCVDPFDSTHETYTERADTLAEFIANTESYGVGDRITAHRGLSRDIVPSLPGLFGLIFIDGSHIEENVRLDAEMAIDKLAVGGVVAFHDYRSETWPAVDKVVGELIDGGGYELIEAVDNLAFIRRRL